MSTPSGNLFDFVRRDPNFNQKNSVQWFMRNVRDLGFAVNVGPMKMLGDNLSKQTNMPSIGRMCMFTYDPKHKEKLPYYDTFPLVVPFAITPTHFTGINFHYLFPNVRLFLLNSLMNFMSDDRLTPKAKMQVSWEIIKRASVTKECVGAVKQYILGRVKSRFVEIDPVDYRTAVHLPVERFKKATNPQVWLDTSNKG